MSKKNILQSAIADAKAIKEAAYKNASSVLMEHMKDQIREFVDSKLNEEEEVKEMEEKEIPDEETEITTEDAHKDESDDLELDETDDDELDLTSEDEEESEEEDEEDDELEEGITEQDLDEVLNVALQEVDHGDLGEMEVVDPEHRADGRGLIDLDSKEKGWEEEEPPHAEDWTVKEAKYKAKIARLAKENMLYKKANMRLQEALDDVRLFNHKVLYTSKLVQTEGLSPKVKRQIIQSMDTSTSLSEVKNTYNTWKAALEVMSESVKGSKKGQKRSLSEAVLGFNQTTGKGVSHINDDHLLNEQKDPYSVSRLQTLAGIIKE